MQEGAIFFLSWDEIYKQLPTLIPVIVGGLIVWIGTLIADRRKLLAEKRTNLRAAYAKWFTTERILTSQIEELLSRVNSTNNLEAKK